MLESRLALYTRLPWGRCLTYVGREGVPKRDSHEPIDGSTIIRYIQIILNIDIGRVPKFR